MIQIRDEQAESYFREIRNNFFGLKYLNSLMRIQDPGWKKFGSGLNKHPGSAILPAGTAITGNLDRRVVDSSHVGPESKPGQT